MGETLRPGRLELELISWIADDYAGASAEGDQELEIDGVHVVIRGSRALIRGSDDQRDWIRNAVVVPWWLRGDSGCGWAGGTLFDARVVYAFLKGKGVDLITGHSRGGGIGQVVGTSLGVRTVTFASPRVLLFGQPDGRAPVVNWVKADDPIRWVVPCYRHVGQHGVLASTGGAFWERHSARAYRSVIADEIGHG